MQSRHVDFLFKPSCEQKENNDNEVEEMNLLYKQLCDPTLKIKLIKQRDKYVAFSPLANYENHLDKIMSGMVAAKSNPDIINQIYLASPTGKSISIYKMLHNQVCIEETGCPNDWSGFNIEYKDRVKYIDLKMFFKYLWYDQLLNSNTKTSTFCKFKLDKYVRNVLSCLNCQCCSDDLMIERIAEHVKSRYINDLDSMISTTLNDFLSEHDLNTSFKRFLEWNMLLGLVPYRKSSQKDTVNILNAKEMNTCFSQIVLKKLLTICNDIPPVSEVAAFVCNDQIQFWHLPTQEMLQYAGSSSIRIENKELCFGSIGETLFYAELRVKHLSEKHFYSQTPQPYIVTEIVKEDNDELIDTNKKSTAIEKQNTLFTSLTKTQNSVFDENNPLSDYSKIQEKNQTIKDYLSKVCSEMNDIQNKMNIFLDGVSPDDKSNLVDEMVNCGLESYLKKIQPQTDNWERTIREHLNKFRMHAVKQLATLPKGLYEFQERASELNMNNNIDIDDFMEDLSSSNMSKTFKDPNISQLEEINKSEFELKQMQDKVSQYFDLAVKFMGYLKDAQKVISKLRIDDSVKDLKVKTLTDQKKEIIKLAKKFREVSNQRVNIYNKQVNELKQKLDKYIHFQSKTAAQTKQHFLSIKDTLLSETGEWAKKQSATVEKLQARTEFLQENFAKQHDSMINHLNRHQQRNIEYIKVEGTIRKTNIDLKIDDRTLVYYRENLKFLWKSEMNSIVPIRETVTKTGVQLLNIDEQRVFEMFFLPFLSIIYESSFYISCKKIEDCARIYGINLAIDVTVKRLLKPVTNVTRTTVIKENNDQKTEEQLTDTGLWMQN